MIDLDWNPMDIEIFPEMEWKVHYRTKDNRYVLGPDDNDDKEVTDS